MNTKLYKVIYQIIYVFLEIQNMDIRTDNKIQVVIQIFLMARNESLIVQRERSTCKRLSNSQVNKRVLGYMV